MRLSWRGYRAAVIAAAFSPLVPSRFRASFRIARTERLTRSLREALLLTDSFHVVVILPCAATFHVVNLSVTRDYELHALPVRSNFGEMSLIIVYARLRLLRDTENL